MAPRGRIGLVVGGWAAAPIRSRLSRGLDDAGFDAYVSHAARFEQALAADGALILKFWLHLPRKERKRRLAGDRPEADGSWQLQDSDEAVRENWDRWLPLADQLLEATDSPLARWHVIDGTQERVRNLAVARLLLTGLQRLLARRNPRPASILRGRRNTALRPNALAEVDLAMRFSDNKVYAAAREKQQGALARLTREAREQGLSTIAAGTAGSWSSASRASRARRSGSVPMTKFWISRASWSRMALFC